MTRFYFIVAFLNYWTVYHNLKVKLCFDISTELMLLLDSILQCKISLLMNIINCYST